MNILHIIHRYYPGRGGAEDVMRGLSERFSRDGDRVEVVTTDILDHDYFWKQSFKRVKKTRERHRGVEIRRFRIMRLPIHRKAMIELNRRLPYLWSKAALDYPSGFAPGMLSLLFRGRAFDIVHAGVLPYNFPIYVAMKYAKLNHIPFIISACCHIGEYQNGALLGEAYTKGYQCWLLNQADKVVVHSNAEGNYLNKKGIAREKIFLCPCGIEQGELEGGDGVKFRKRYNLNGPIIFQLSVQAHDKGSPYLLEAMKILWRKGINVSLVLAGAIHGDFIEYLRSLPEDVRKRCLVLGHISEEEKKDLLACGDIMVMASRTDSFGIVYLESWFYGKPVIGARAGGVPEVIRDGRDGYLVSFGDSGELAERIFELIKNENLRKEMGEAGRQKVLRDYTWEKVYQRMRRLYNDLVKINA